MKTIKVKEFEVPDGAIGDVEAGCTKSNFIKGLKMIEDYMQLGRY